ncbi:MAG: DUF1207 domain-containing protein, partial [Nitrospira sp.]
ASRPDDGLADPGQGARRTAHHPGARRGLKSFEELNWVINTNVVGGVEWSMDGSSRRFRFLLNYYHGFNPYGQFFAQKVETVGFGLYLSL